MDRARLLEIAEEGGFFSYAAGVASQILTHYRVRGLEIDNYRTDLPVQKGLSSSAAICVLVARAFNRLYDLKLTVRGEMEYAYLGEITTPSRCGRLDQGCAYGSRPILMTFDGDRLDVAELSRLEMNHRKFIWQSVQKLRKTPGYADVYLIETAGPVFTSQTSNLVTLLGVLWGIAMRPKIPRRTGSNPITMYITPANTIAFCAISPVLGAIMR